VRTTDRIRFCTTALRENRLRSMLSLLGIAIGIAAVVLLTSIGEGARSYVMQQFTMFGTNLGQVTPGRTETSGIPGLLGGSTRKLTLADAEALRRVRGVVRSMPVVFGQAAVSAGGLSRNVYVMGVTRDAPALWKFGVQRGSFDLADDPRRSGGTVVLGPKLARELFRDEDALGRFVRVGDVRLRVVGVMRSKGELLAFDIDDSAYVDLATGMQLFNTDELAEIDFEFVSSESGDAVVARLERLLEERHGRLDATVMTQAAMLDVFDNVLRAITIAVASIGGVSLLVGALGILTILWIAVGERTHEIGLLRALGATRVEVQQMFLFEAAVLSGMGGVAGLALGALGLAALAEAVPALPLVVQPLFVLLALGISLVVGLASGWAPARKAAGLDPIEALREE
jgi:putative ABC transport system permease protein